MGRISCIMNLILPAVLKSLKGGKNTHTHTHTHTHTLLYMYIYGVACVFSHIKLFEIPWTLGHQAPLSMGFSRQECWSGLPFSPLGDLPDAGIEPVFPKSPALAGRFFTTEPPGKPHVCVCMCMYICIKSK